MVIIKHRRFWLSTLCLHKTQTPTSNASVKASPQAASIPLAPEGSIPAPSPETPSLAQVLSTRSYRIAISSSVSHFSPSSTDHAVSSSQTTRTPSTVFSVTRNRSGASLKMRSGNSSYAAVRSFSMSVTITVPISHACLLFAELNGYYAFSLIIL
jgi:hypothetical protein